MIGDHAEHDIAGARRAISAVTLQKVHEGVAIGVGDRQPDASVPDFDSLRALFRRLRAASR